jgi:hypothetical protein
LAEESIIYLLSTWVETVQKLHGQERARTDPEQACEAEARVARISKVDTSRQHPAPGDAVHEAGRQYNKHVGHHKPRGAHLVLGRRQGDRPGLSFLSRS